jgi:hypothetical protein
MTANLLNSSKFEVEFQNHAESVLMDFDMIQNDVDILDEPVYDEEILHALSQMKIGKAQGVDGLVIEMYKSSIHLMLPYLNILCNACLKQGTFPAELCKAIMCPVYRKGSTSDPNNYRGISLLNVMGKIFTKVLNNRLVFWA